MTDHIWRVIFFSFALLCFSWTEAKASPMHPYEGAPEDQAIIDELLEGWFSAEPPTRIIYVAPPEGSALGTGTREDPLRDLISAVNNAELGDAIYLAPGVYRMSEIRDLWGHSSSVLRSNASGERGRPIILSTDPEAFDPSSDQIAVIDFQYDNIREGSRSMSFSLSHDFWLIENLEFRNMWQRGIWLQGYDNVIRDNHFHHAETDGTNNEGFVLVVASGRPTNNVIMGNHFHHIGIIPDRTTGEVTDYGGVNVACVYTETRQTYDSPLPDPSTNPTPEDYEAAVLPADNYTYLFNNYIHHCRMGLSTKNVGNEGPYFFLSNIIHDVHVGIRTSYRDSLIRNNIIYPGDSDVELSTGISIGQAVGDGYFPNVGNAVGVEASHNTVVDAPTGLSFRGGWNVRSHHNLVVNSDEVVHIHRNAYFWYMDGAWPGIRGEYTLGDLTPDHPYYDIMPNYLQAKAGQYMRLNLEDNCYTAEPVIAPADFVQPENDITGQIVDTTYEVVAADEVELLFTTPSEGDYTRDLSQDLYEQCGSRIGTSTLPTDPDGGPGDGGPSDGGPDGSPDSSPRDAGLDGSADGGADDSGPDRDASTAGDADVGSDETTGGCSCRSLRAQPSAGFLVTLALLVCVATRCRRP